MPKIYLSEMIDHTKEPGFLEEDHVKTLSGGAKGWLAKTINEYQIDLSDDEGVSKTRELLTNGASIDGVELDDGSFIGPPDEEDQVVQILADVGVDYTF